MKGKHVFHIALFVVALFGGYQIGTAIYTRYLKGTTTTTTTAGA